MKNIKTGHHYPITKEPYTLLKEIMSMEVNLLKRTTDRKHARPNTLFLDAFYYGKSFNQASDVQISIPIVSIENELDTLHREQLKKAYSRIKSRNDIKTILTNWKSWKIFCHTADVILEGLSHPDLQERHPFVDTEFIENIRFHYSVSIAKYDVHFNEIDSLKQELVNNINLVIENIGG